MGDYRDVTISQPPATPPAGGPGAEEPAVVPVLTPAQAKRANSTVIGMLLALGVSIAVFLPVVLLNPTSKPGSYDRNVDVPAAAGQARDVAGYLPLAPELPEGWSVNFARWNAGGADAVPYWEVGYLTPSQEFIGLTQTSAANPTWLADLTGQAPVTGERSIAGRSWQLRDAAKAEKSLVGTVGTTTVVLKGSADFAEFDVIGSAISAAESAPAADPQGSAAPAAAGTGL